MCRYFKSFILSHKTMSLIANLVEPIGENNSPIAAYLCIVQKQRNYKLTNLISSLKIFK